MPGIETTHAGRRRWEPTARASAALVRADHFAARIAAVPQLTFRLLAICALFAVLCVAGGLLLFGRGHQHEFFRDLGPASIVTSALTLTVAAVGLVIARREAHRHDWRDVNNFWFLSGVGFLYLTIDAPLDLHGRIGEGLAIMLGRDSLPGIHRMSDGVLVGYAALGILVAGAHLRDLVVSRRAFTYLMLGAIATLVMLGIDASGGPKPWAVVAEESIELAAASFFVGAYATRYRMLQ